MAGKKKANDVQLSKTAKRSKGRDGKERLFIPSADLKSRIVSLNGGTHAYILRPDNGRTEHVKVDSDRYRELIEELGLNADPGAVL